MSETLDQQSRRAKRNKDLMRIHVLPRVPGFRLQTSNDINYIVFYNDEMIGRLCCADGWWNVYLDNHVTPFDVKHSQAFFSPVEALEWFKAPYSAGGIV